MPNNIIVAGSTNMDMVVNTGHIPVPGETVLAGSFFMNPGGKGANQAVAIARLGGSVQFISKVGNDVFGRQASRMFDMEGVNIKYLFSDEEQPSGVALITVEQSGENCIVVAPGANAALVPADMEQALDDIGASAMLLMQLEIPLPTVKYLVDYAANKKVKVMLNPAPAATLDKDLLRNIDIITPNMTEAALIAGIKVNDVEDAKKAARIIYEMGVATVIVTIGAQGAVVCEKGELFIVSSPKVTAVDTTAAGDVFNGALAVALAEGRSIADATHFACIAASISVTRKGAQSSIPYRNELIGELFTLGSQ
ncbi:MAG: ribokinase [Niabella sp.]